MQNKNNDGDDDIGYKTSPDFLFFLKNLQGALSSFF